MSIRFTGTHMFKLDRSMTTNEAQIIAQRGLLKGLTNGGCRGITMVIPREVQKLPPLEFPLIVISGEDEADDKLILENAKKLGIEASSIASTTESFPLQEDGFISKKFTQWFKDSKIYNQPVYAIQNLLLRIALEGRKN